MVILCLFLNVAKNMIFSGIVRHSIVNDLPLGRSVEEAIRMVDALQVRLLLYGVGVSVR